MAYYCVSYDKDLPLNNCGSGTDGNEICCKSCILHELKHCVELCDQASSSEDCKYRINSDEY